jgi:hypothetical protein
MNHEALKVENELLRAQLREALAALQQYRQAVYYAVNMDYNEKSRIGIQKAQHRSGTLLFKHQRSGFIE